MKNSFKKLLFSGLLFLGCYSTVFSQPKGHWLVSAVTSDSLNLKNMQFADSNVGYISGSLTKHYKDQFGRDKVYPEHYYSRTIDGGITWMPMSFGKYSPVQQDKSYFSIKIATPSIAYIHAFYKDSGSTRSSFVLLKTTNSGLSWLEVPFPGDVFIQKFFSEQFGYGFAQYIDSGKINYRYGGALIYTVDGGKRWFDIPQRDFNYTINGVNYRFSPSVLSKGIYVYIDSSHLIFDSGIDTRNSQDSGIDYVPRYGFTSFLTTDRGSNWEVSNWIDPVIPNMSRIVNDTFFAPPTLKTVRSSQTIFRFMLSRSLSNILLPGYYSDDSRDDGINGGAGYRYYSSPLTTFYRSTNYGQEWTANRSFLGRVRDMVATSSDDIWMTAITKPFQNDTINVFGKYLKDTVINGTNTQVLDSGLHIEIDSRIWKKNHSYSASWIVHSTDGGVNWDIDSNTLRDVETNDYDSRILRSSDPNHLWIGAMKEGKTYVFRYKAPAINAVEDDHRLQESDYPNFINIFPNPSTDKVTVGLWHQAGIQQIRIYDILGRAVIAPSKQLTQSSFELDVSMVAPGAYILVCSIAGGSNIARTIVVNK